MARFTDLRVAVLATDGFEEMELTHPGAALTKEGAWVEVISPADRPIQAFNHLDKTITVAVDMKLADARPENYDALVLPGGALNADALRTLPEVQTFVRSFQEAGKPMAVICHAPWLLVSAGLVRGRTLTSYHTLQDDIRNAGGKWRDTAVVNDDNWVTSRQPSDLPAFIPAMFELIERTAVAAAR
ncbi:MAG TPA: type 1 glutamine amidotransferase domain-containing protein [Gemmataceae bacterium]|nr:type 1 glutamine amidotransferase domain-containing protein [Gemmataceae bacterium]